MICEKCKIEFGGDACPQCKGKENKRLQQMVASPDGIAENYNVVRLKRERCRKCLKQLACSVVGKAKKSKPGTIIGGLFVAKLYEGRAWQMVLDCREFTHTPGKKPPNKAEKKDGFVGDLFGGG